MLPPSHCLEVHSIRARKGLSLKALAAMAEVNYYRACRVLKGRQIDPKALKSLERAAKRAPMPAEGGLS